jgi:porphobilinogen synthase
MPAVTGTTLVRGRLAEHPLWARALSAATLASRIVKPVIVSARVEDRERVPDAPWLERLSLTELVRDARAAASAGIAGFLVFGTSDRKDESAMIASERDHVVARAIRAVKDAAPDLAVATDVCVCAYTPHGQCVLFSQGDADVDETLRRLAEIALVHADAGADLLMPSGMLDGATRALRTALSDHAHAAVPVAPVIKLESQLYATHRRAVEAMPVQERAVPLIAPEDRDAPRERALREIAAGADGVAMKPGLPALDHVVRIAAAADRPVISYFTADEHALYASESLADSALAERQTIAAARRAGADLVITYAALDTGEV